MFAGKQLVPNKIKSVLKHQPKSCSDADESLNWSYVHVAVRFRGPWGELTLRSPRHNDTLLRALEQRQKNQCLFTLYFQRDESKEEGQLKWGKRVGRTTHTVRDKYFMRAITKERIRETGNY